MPRNYEIKARIPHLPSVKRAAKKLILSGTNHSQHTENQKDIYYRVAGGRLKLRIINGNRGNLIFYRRKENRGKRVSDYSIYNTDNPNELDALLRKTLGVYVIVTKKREVFITDNVRIHIDRVYRLGNYLEFEIIFNSFKSAVKKMNQLMNYFGLKSSDLIKNSYSDLILKNK